MPFHRDRLGLLTEVRTACRARSEWRSGESSRLGRPARTPLELTSASGKFHLSTELRIAVLGPARSGDRPPQPIPCISGSGSGCASRQFLIRSACSSGESLRISSVSFLSRSFMDGEIARLSSPAAHDAARVRYHAPGIPRLQGRIMLAFERISADGTDEVMFDASAHPGRLVGAR